MKQCDARCIYECGWYDSEAGCCGYKLKTKKSRGELRRMRNGRLRYVYPDPCDKFKPREGVASVPHTLNFESLPVKTVREKPRKRTLRDYPERNALYERGLTDREIANELNVSIDVIQNWRYNRGMPANSAKPDFSDREEYYRQGLTDREIADRAGVTCNTIVNWRNRRGYPPNAGPRKRIEKKEFPSRRKLYELGLTDEAIAKAENCSRVTICNWRRRNNLPPNKKKEEDK